MRSMKVLMLLIGAGAFSATAMAQGGHGAGHGGDVGSGQGAGMIMDMGSMQSMMETMMPADGDTESTKAYKRADMDMMHGMAIDYTGDPDIDFRLKMIPHHQGAIDMAKVALEHGADPDTKRLAEAIIAAQEREIAEMREWLEEHPQ
ncbi:CopM family metallochaperone [Pararhizobium haloflavum]|uniref:CopM family metallochaperone n=1 Tax=Pararhizobium haloflavum TaxID=2037914 RepID=UPI001FE16878|nr:DUF305 domain-containing protein [Pararhizobium haloflavum]